MHSNVKVCCTLPFSPSSVPLYDLFVLPSLSEGLSDAPGRTATFIKKDYISRSDGVMIFVLNMDTCHINTKDTSNNIGTATYFIS